MTFFVTDQASHIHGMEWDLWGAIFVLDEVQGHHDHAGDPEEDDVKARYQHGGWVVHL